MTAAVTKVGTAVAHLLGGAAFLPALAHSLILSVAPDRRPQRVVIPGDAASVFMVDEEVCLLRDAAARATRDLDRLPYRLLAEGVLV